MYAATLTLALWLGFAKMIFCIFVLLYNVPVKQVQAGMDPNIPNMAFFRRYYTEELMSLEALPNNGISFIINQDLLGSELFFSSYPDAWLREYGREQYFLQDPVILTALAAKHDATYLWPTLPFPDVTSLFARSAEFGIRQGLLVVRINGDKRSMCSIAHPDGQFSPEQQQAITTIFDRVLDKHAARKKVTQKQIDLLQCLTDGQSLAEASKTLKTSESALKSRLSSLRSKFECETTNQTIHIATRLNIV